MADHLAQRSIDEAARRALREWAVARHCQGDRSFSELAEETGLAVEEIMLAIGDQGRDQALQMFLASCETVAKTTGKPEFLRLAREAVQTIREES